MCPLLIGHRGYGESKNSDAVQENTVDAVIMASYNDYVMVELDVHLTLDKQVVLWHDHTLFFSTNHGGYIAEVLIHQMTYEELLAILDKPDIILYREQKSGESVHAYIPWIDAKTRRPKMQLLEDVMNACPDMRIMIELKVPPTTHNDTHYKHELVGLVANLCKQHQQYPKQYVAASFDVMAATLAKKTGIKSLLLVSEEQNMALLEALDLAYALKLDGVVAHHSLIPSRQDDVTDLEVWSYGALCPHVSTCIIDPPPLA
jgi:glycerophosphoryl diester phosphodiesterase